MPPTLSSDNTISLFSFLSNQLNNHGRKEGIGRKERQERFKTNFKRNSDIKVFKEEEGFSLNIFSSINFKSSKNLKD